MIRVLIVGSGDVARRVLPMFVNRFRVYALVRNPDKASWWRERGVLPVIADLDRRATLDRLRGLAQWILHFAPPREKGMNRNESEASRGKIAEFEAHDARTRNLIASLSGRGSLPQRFVYISTSGVYGDCAGLRIDETRPPAPTTARAMRRVDAETCLRRWARRSGVRLSILRVPGIYAAERLPIPRIEAGTPVLERDCDVFTNHIHAQDLAAAARRSLLRGRSNRIYHVADDSEMRMGDYFDCVADAFGLARPPRVSRAEAPGLIPAALLSFMSESRRLDNTRMKRELGLRLAWPRVDLALEAIAQGRARENC